jgi:Pyruvate/2-oxoacid:ferredoxin oxidoreductase gamma subunit
MPEASSLAEPRTIPSEENVTDPVANPEEPETDRVTEAVRVAAAGEETGLGLAVNVVVVAALVRVTLTGLEAEEE